MTTSPDRTTFHQICTIAKTNNISVPDGLKNWFCLPGTTQRGYLEKHSDSHIFFTIIRGLDGYLGDLNLEEMTISTSENTKPIPEAFQPTFRALMRHLAAQTE